MGVLQRFERRIEELVNKPFAKAFKAEVQPVEIASALQRECDDRAAIVARGHTMVPNDFVVELGPRDHERLSVYVGPLSDELASMVREHADEQRYSFLGPVDVRFEQAEDLDTGMFRVRSSVVAGAHREPPPTPVVPTPSTRGGWAAPPSEAAGRAIDQRRPPAPSTPSTPWLELGARRFPLDQPLVVVGRGGDVDLRLDDPGVSRRHAELRVTSHGVVLRDLGSTNGVIIDGERVAGATLREGSRVRLGNTTVVFHDGGR